MNSKFLDCTVHVNPGSTAMQILAAIQEQFSTTKDAIGNGCTPETYHPHRIICRGVVNELEVSPNVHRSDEENFRSDTVVRHFTGRFRQGCWIFVGQGSEKTRQFDKWDKPANPEEKWDRKASQIKKTFSASGHPVIPGTTIFEQGNLRPQRGKFTSVKASSL